MRHAFATIAVFGPLVILSCTLTAPTGELTDGVCAAGLKACASKCVGLADPATGCGSTGCSPCAVPNAKAACGADRACALGACEEGFADCDGNAANGCETSLKSDALNCGKCGSACASANGAPTCVAGVCGVGACSAGFDDCNKDSTDGCEAPIATDAKNCGKCGAACTDGHPCQAGVCISVSRLFSSSASLHTCALISNGTVRCWGLNDRGQVGDDDGCTKIPCDNKTSAKEVKGLTDVIAVATGADHTCAIKKGGAVFCWGGNGSGQLGLGQPDTDPHPAPTAVPTLTKDVTAVSAGGGFTCALKTDGSMWCWGNNDFGQLALGNAQARSVPTQVAGVADGTSVSAGPRTSCVLRGVGNVSNVFCAGNNELGQLGTTEPSVDTCVGGGGDNCSYTLRRMTFTPADAVSVACGARHTCVLRATKQVFCAGTNANGQLGTGGTPSSSSTPLAVLTESGPGSFASLSAGAAFTCGALQGSRLAACWGVNSKGELFAPGSVQTLSRAAANPNVGRVAATATGSHHSCIVREDARVLCAGANQFGQLGIGTAKDDENPDPKPVLGLP